MSKYTTEIRFMCEVESGLTTSAGFNSINDILTTAAPKIFNFDFPIFDENYRLPLEIKILRHYYTREICEETVGLWQLRLQDKLNMIMPYYNQLYSSELIKFNPLYDVDLTRERNTENHGESESINTVSNSSITDTSNTSNNSTVNTTSNQNTTTTQSDTETTGNLSSTINKTNTRKDKYSDTPQGAIGNLENDTYLTNARIISDNGADSTTSSDTSNSSVSGSVTGNGSGNSNTQENGTFQSIANNSSESSNIGSGNVTNTEEYTEHVFGKQGTVSNSKMLKEFRETFLNIDKMLIDELSTLFFGLW